MDNTSKDRDARVGHKSADDAFFGYKTHIAMTPERIITAATVTSGEKGDGPELANLVQKSRCNGVDVDVIIGDAAYSGKDNIKMATEEDIELVSRLNPNISQGNRKDEDRFDYNKDAGMFVCPAGHMAIRKARQGKKGQGTNQAMVYFFDVEKCKTCALREGCYKDGAKTKSYSVSIKSDEHKAQMKFQETERFKLLSRERYKIEAKNSELKNVLGYDRALSYGLSYMEMQGAMTIFAANIRRIVKMMAK
ncbi:MAG: transposase [Bacteroidales bacterium]|nr:transposase [Bacteroidales bacterium]